MIKLPLLLLFLALSLALPTWTVWRSRGDALLVSIGQGVLIYLLSTALSNLLSALAGLEDLALAEDRRTYAVVMTLSLALAVGLFALLKVYRDERKAGAIYAGFSFANTFVYNVNSYGILLYVGANHSLEKLSGTYPEETARELLAYYDGIAAGDLALLCLELLLTFFILKGAMCAVCQKERPAMNWLLFVVTLFFLFYAQYCIQNKFLGFTVYLALFGMEYHGTLRMWKEKITRRG